MEKDIPFETVDKKVQYLLDAAGVNRELLSMLELIIDASDTQSNQEYMEALEYFDSKYTKPCLN